MSNRNDTLLVGAAGAAFLASAALYLAFIKPLAPTENTPNGSLTRQPAGEPYPATPRAEILGGVELRHLRPG